MSTNLKYGNKPVWLAPNGDTFSSILFSPKEWKRMGGKYFASKLEYDTYVALIVFGKKYRIPVEILHQHRFTLLCDDTHTRLITWNIDFKIIFNANPLDYLLIESKGIELPDYKIKRDILAICHPLDFHRLIIVTDVKDLHSAIIQHISTEA